MVRLSSLLTKGVFDTRLPVHAMWYCRYYNEPGLLKGEQVCLRLDHQIRSLSKKD